MATGALFGGSSTRPQGKHLAEFRAGKMFMKGKMVHPDKRKGTVYVYQSDDSLMHFCWKDRTKNVVEDDLIIFPDDCEFKRVTQCTTGRVYLLKFKSTARKMFFWMQEPKTDKDEENARKVNENLNNPPTPNQSRGGGGLGALGGLPPELAAGLGGDSDLSNVLGNMSQQQLMQLLGGMGMGGLGGLVGGRPGSSQPESTPPSRVQSSPGPRSSSKEGATSVTPQPPRPITAAALPSQSKDETSEGKNSDKKSESPEGASATDSSGKIQLKDLQNILTGMEEKDSKAIDLASIITPEMMIPILANSEVQERLKPFLPEGESLLQTEAELKETISTPQFQQAMNTFSAALASGQLGSLMSQFNLGEAVSLAAANGDVEAFAKAMQEAEKKKNQDN